MYSLSDKFKGLDSNSKIRFFIGVAVVLIFQIWNTYKGEGVAKTFDSLAYLKAAENLVLNQKIIQGQSYTTWALGFPFLLILFKDSIFLNLLCFLGLYVFYFDLTQKLVQKSLTKWWLILAFAFSTPLYLIHHFVWSEPPFLLFLLGSIWAFYYLSYSNDNKIDNHIDLKKLFLFCLFGFLFMSMRNAGLYFIVALCSGIILFYMLPLFYVASKNNLSVIYQTIYFKILLCFSISSLPSIFLWWLHAKPKTVATFATMYSLAERTFLEECLNYGDILSRWLLPPSIPLEIRILIVIIFFTVFLIILLIVFLKLFLSYFFYKELINKNVQFIFFIFWITSFYLVGMLISRAGMKVDAERYLAILYPFLCILIGFILDKMKINDYLKYGIAFLWLIYPFLRTIKNIVFWN